MQYRRSMAKEATWPVICTMLVSVCCSGCLIEPSRRNLTLEEEKQLQKQTEYTYSLPREQQDVGQKQVECNREILEKKDWHAGDILLDSVSEKKSKCEPIEKASQSDVMKDNRGTIDAVIDKNLKDALDKSQK
jgi:hypothetical protein